MKITLGFSTLRNNYFRLIDDLKELDLGEEFEVLVVAQDFDCASKEIISGKSTIAVIKDSSIGLSMSRNLIIEHAKGDLIWFLDDDVIIDEKYLEDLLERVKNGSSDVYLGRIECSDCEGMYKKYRSSSFKLVMALRASSIEILVDRNFLINSRIKFDTNLGLGAKYPSGEENAFLADLIRCGAKFYDLAIPIVKHPCLIEDRMPQVKWKDPNVLTARGIVARRFGWLSPLILLYFLAQTIAVTKSVHGFRWLFFGYFKFPIH